MNAAQQKILERARQRLSGQSVGIYDEDEDETNTFSPSQQSILNAARERLGASAVSQSDAPTGLGGVYNAARQGLSDLAGIPDVVAAEDLSRIADYEQDRADRDARGELPLWERILTAQLKREDPAQLRAQAADAAKRRVDRYDRSRAAFPLSEAGSAQIQDISKSGFLEGLSKVARKPLATGLGVLEVAAQQTPSILAAAGTTALTRSPTLGAAIMGGSTYAQERYGQLLNDAAEAGYDLRDPAQAQAAVQDKSFMDAQAEKGRTRGIIVGTVDLLTAGLASKTPLTLAGVGKNTGIQAVGGGTGEAAAQVASGEEIQGGEVLIEALAEGVTAPVDVAALGLRTGGKFREQPTQSQTNLRADLAQQLAEEEAQLQAQALAEEQKQQKQAEALDDAVYEVRAEAAKTFTPEEKFMAERKKARDTQNKAAVADPQTELGAAFKNFLKAQREAGKAPIYGGKKLEAAQKEFLKGYDKDNQERYDAEDLAAYEQALDLHAQQLADGTITPEVKAEPSVNAAVSEERKQEINVEAENIAEELSPTIVTSQPAAVDPMTIPIRQRKDAIKQTEALVEDGSLSPNWAEENDDLNGAVNGQKFNIKKYKTALDEVLNPVDETTTEAETETAPLSVPLNNEQLRQSLKPQQVKVYDALLKAVDDKATGNLVTVEWKSGEKENESRGWAVEVDNKALAKLSRIENPNSAKTAVSGFLRAFNDTFTGAQVREALIQADALNTEAETLTAEEGQQFAAGTGGDGTLNTVGTAGGTQTEGASANQSAKKKAEETKRFKAAGMTDEQIKAFYNPQREADTAEAELAGQVLEDVENARYAVENADRLLRAQWAASSVEGGPSYDDLSMNNKIDWMETVYATLGQANQSEVLAERANALGGITDATAQDNESGRTEVQEPSREETGSQLSEDTGRRTETDAEPAESDGEGFTAGQQKTAVVETKKKRKIDRSKIKFGLLSDLADKLRTQLLDDSPESKRQRFENVVKDLTGKTGAYNAEIFDTFADFAAARIRGDINAKVDFGSSENAIPSDAYAFTIPDVKGRPVAFFFLDRIPAGRERAVFMHEVGGHVGIDEILSVEERENIQTKIEKWAISDEQNLENIVARRALQRVQNARDAFKAKDPFFGFMLDSEVTAETIGYFLEEATFAGVEPSVTTALGRLVRDLYAAFKRALRKVGLQPDNLTPKDIVDIGWGAARFQLSTRKHGTAQDFKKFDHMKMGSGEGAQVYGWGTYLAERLGIARWYMDQDIKRKERDLLNSPRVMNFTANNLAKFSTFSPLLQKVIKSTKPKGVSVDLSRFANLSEDSNIGSVGYDPAFDELFVFYKTKNGMGRTLPLLPLVRSTSLEDDSVPFDLYDEVDEIKKELKANYDKFQKELDVQGALLHVDTTVDNDELLRWDEPQRGQTADNIVNLLKSMDRYDALNIIEGAQQANGSIVNDTDILDRTRQAIGVVEGTDDQSAGDGLFEETVENVTGRDLYAAMAIYDGRFDNALMDYLDTKTMMNKVFKLADGEWVESDAVRDDDGMLVPHMLHRSDKVVSMLLDQAGVKGVIYPDAGTRGAPLDPIGMANNQVIFNDENVFIVGSTPGGSVSKKRYSVDEIKFGRNADWVGNTFGAPAKNAYDTTVDIAKGGAKSVAFLHDLVRKHGDKMPAIKRWYEGMLKAEAIRNEIRMGFEDIAVRARDLKLDRLALVNDFLGKSTFFQQWGYDPKDYHPDLFAKKEVKVNDIMEKAFGRLTKDEKQLVADVFAHGEKMRQRKVEIAKKLGVEGKFFTDAALDGPYAPLKRFGRHVAELKSAELVAAEKRLETSDTKENKKTVNELKSKPEHYIIRFFDTSGSAQQFVDANASKYAESAATEKAPDVEIDRVTNPEVYEKIIARLNAGPEAKIASEAKTAFKEMVKNLYFQSLDERSARLSGSRRLNRAGYEPNMMRSFLSHARAEASLISQMETGTEVNSALAEAGKQVKGDKTVRDPERQSVYNMIVRHYRDGLVNRNTPFQALQDRVTAINSAYMLTSSIGYHLTNATQPAMVTVPKIAGDFNNYSGAWSALFKGYKVAMSATRMSRDMQTRIDLEKAPVQYRKLLENLQLRQLLDVGMEEDLSEFDRFNTGLEFVDKASEGLGRIAHKLYQVARFVEAQNRISAAVAAYDMAQKDPKRLSATKMNALDYAVSVVEDSQGNFSRLDAPLLIKVLPKVTVQYRKYQLLMAWHYSKAFKQSFLNEDPVTTAIGRRTLAYSIAHAALGAGATGIPLLSTAFWLTTFLGDEDEPDDLERAIKRVAGDDTLGTVLSRGLFAGFGVDLSTKLNQSKIFHPLPYVDFQTGESGAKDIFFNALAGPSGTTGVNFYRAHEYFKQGDLLKGIEYSVPKGIRTAMESYRLATEGYTMRNGDVVVDPREIDAFSLLVNAMGIPATEIQEIKWTRGQQYELEQYFSKESGKIRKKYVEANKARNRNKMQSLREEWRELQDAKDRVRPFFNNARGVLNRQSVSDLIKAPREQRKREQKARRQLTGN